MRTTADEKLASADESVTKAINDLSEVLVERCWGSDQFLPEYHAKIRAAYASLLEVRALLARGTP